MFIESAIESFLAKEVPRFGIREPDSKSGRGCTNVPPQKGLL